MERNQWVLLGIALSMAGASSVLEAADQASPALSSQSSPAWSAKMQGLYKTLADLLTDITSDKRFSDPSNRNRIDTEAQKLASLAHELNTKDIANRDADPTIPMLAALLKQETKLAATELKAGHRTYARGILQLVPAYCIACHTRNATGPQFSRLPFEPTSQSLTPLERGEFYAATRQFDRAQQEFIQVINNRQVAGAYDFAWERAIHESLAIAVRVRKDPVQAQDIVHTVLGMWNGPSSVLEDARAWNASIQDWKAEPPHQAMTEEGLRAEALRLMDKARETQKYPMDRNADILYLRASAATHDLLQAAPQGEHTSEAFLIAGIAYEVLSPLKTEDLHDIYYEACVRVGPHSPTANLCYRRYEQSVLFGYSGSSGVDLPTDIHNKLLELKTLAAPPVQAGVSRNN